MIKIESFGSFAIFAEDTTSIFDDNKAITIRLYNGADEIAHETQYNVYNLKQAARDFMRRIKDSYIFDDITAACKIVSYNGTDCEAVLAGNTVYFRRWAEDSRYFKQLAKKPLRWME